MHSFWQRLNAIFFFTLSVLGFCCFLAAGTTYWHVADPQIELKLERILLRQIKGAGHDQAILSLGINADLRSLFNWNVKQLFVYVTAEYETEANVLNQVVVWDTIISDVGQARTMRAARAHAPAALIPRSPHMCRRRGSDRASPRSSTNTRSPTRATGCGRTTSLSS